MAVNRIRRSEALDSNKGHYEILGLEPDAPVAQIERAYLFVKGIYADPALGAQLGGKPDELAAQRESIEEAYKVLRDPTLRRAYDRARKMNGTDRRGKDREVVQHPPVVAPIPKNTTVPPPVGPFSGKVLRAYRTARGVSLEQIARETKIRTHYLESIETDRYSAFPAALYLKGYLQAYCRVLGLDSKDVCDSYLKRVSGGEPPLGLGAR